jgi:hypothetical protein
MGDDGSKAPAQDLDGHVSNCRSAIEVTAQHHDEANYRVEMRS